MFIQKKLSKPFFSLPAPCFIPSHTEVHCSYLPLATKELQQWSLECSAEIRGNLIVVAEGGRVFYPFALSISQLIFVSILLTLHRKSASLSLRPYPHLFFVSSAVSHFSISLTTSPFLFLCMYVITDEAMGRKSRNDVIGM